MANERVTQTYAQAIFEQALAGWVTPLKVVAAALAQAGSIEKLDNASVAFSEKHAIILRALPANTKTEIQNLISLLASKNEVHLLPQVIAQVEQLSQHNLSGSVAQVTSAIALTSAEQTAIEAKMRAQFDQVVRFEYAVDAAILGGVIVRVGDKVIDGSVAGKLAELKEKLK